MANSSIRNIAIIAHVDHGKTTLVDGLLKQSKTFRDNEAEMGQTLIMDSGDQERERGITILAKNTTVNYHDTKINIIDTPGHADFGGEVERTLNMADGAILVIDAQEGPMPQTKFVLKKALDLNLKIIVVINKIDKPNARVQEVVERTSDLFLDLAQDETHLDFPVFYSIARDGKAWPELPADFTDSADLSCIFDAIIRDIPEPMADPSGDFQMLISALDWDSYQGKYAIGKITRGVAQKGLSVALVNGEGIKERGKIDKLFVNVGLKRSEVDSVAAGDIVAITGIRNAGIGETVAGGAIPEALPSIAIEEPTLSMAVSVNTSPFAGREGKNVTGRQILERIQKELETNVSLKLRMGGEGEYILSGRGELHLSVFIENLRREGYELQIGKPEVITKIIDGAQNEPVEELTIDVESQYADSVIAEVIRRKGILLHQNAMADGSTRLEFEITTRGLLGLSNRLLTISRGTSVSNSLFLRYEPLKSAVGQLRNGALIASETGKAVVYGLNNAQGRGTTFIEPQTLVYKGMIVGLNSREGDLEINVAKEKQLTNIRSNAEISVVLERPNIMSLEQCIDFLEDDELLEVTPTSLRLRKKLLDPVARHRARGK